jgi:hypothetical protein
VPLALRYREDLRGTWFSLDAPEDERPASFDLSSQLSFFRLLDRRPAETSGRLRLEGLATDVIVRGRLRVDGRTRSLTYAFPFIADDGRACSLVGQKDLLAIHLLESFFELSASLHVEGVGEVGRAILRGPPSSPFLDLLKTARLAWVGF